VKALRWLFVLALGVVGVVMLSAATMNRPDEVREDVEAEITFVLQTKDWSHGLDNAAAAVWGTCISTLSLPSTPVGTPVVVPAGETEATVTVVVRPAPGTNAVRRLRGCLDDALVDRVKNHVISWNERPATL
jgi:hypothetical protein